MLTRLRLHRITSHISPMAALPSQISTTTNNPMTVAVICPPENVSFLSAINMTSRNDGVQFIIANDLHTFTAHPNFSTIRALLFVAVGGKVSLLPTLYEACGTVEWVHSLFAGVDALAPFIASHLLSDNIPLTNGRGAFSSSLAEYVMASALHFNKQIPRIQHNQQTKTWDKFIMPTLKGKTMGFVGFGHIGQTSAKLAKQFGMKILALRRNPTKIDHDGIADVVLGLPEKRRLFEESDFVVSVLPGTQETVNFCSVDEFSAMKKEGIFISVGRGLVVDEEALADALENDEIAGAALDVFKTEPLPSESRLWTVPTDRILLTAHNADFTSDYWESGCNIFEQNLVSYLQGGRRDGDLCTPVDKHCGY